MFLIITQLILNEFKKFCKTTTSLYCKASVQEDKEGICFQFESQGILKSVEEGKRERRKERKMGMQIHSCIYVHCDSVSLLTTLLHQYVLLFFVNVSVLLLLSFPLIDLIQCSDPSFATSY